MRTLAAMIMIANAALFTFGAVQHVGITLGAFHEPRIIPAAIVETICSLALLAGAGMLLAHARAGWTAALTGNLVSLTGVIIGIVALNLGAGPRTASNDLYHRIMLLLIAITLVILFAARTAASRS